MIVIKVTCCKCGLMMAEDFENPCYLCQGEEKRAKEVAYIELLREISAKPIPRTKVKLWDKEKLKRNLKELEEGKLLLACLLMQKDK